MKYTNVKVLDWMSARLAHRPSLICDLLFYSPSLRIILRVIKENQQQQMRNRNCVRCTKLKYLPSGPLKMFADSWFRGFTPTYKR